MGQEQYLLRTGVGFDIDRSGAKDSFSFLESLADSINNMQTKKSVDGITKRNAKLKKLNDDLEKLKNSLKYGKTSILTKDSFADITLLLITFN